MSDEILVKSSDIQKRLKEIAQEINEKYDEITLMVVLTGGIYTAIDLSKYITIPCKLEFIKVSSYGHNEFSNGVVEMKYCSSTKGDLLGNVLIIDDICDSGRTLKTLLEYVKNNYFYYSLKTLTLLNKPSRREVQIKPDYVGFEIEDKFVYGFGLDLNDYARNIQDILVKGEEESVF